MNTTDFAPQTAAVEDDTFAQASRMALVAQKVVDAKQRADAGAGARASVEEAGITQDDLPDLFAYLVSLGVMSAAQARALAEAFASGDLSGLPDLPSQGNEFFYDAFLAGQAQGFAKVNAGDAADAPPAVEEIIEAVVWVVEHAPVIIEAAKAIADAASSFWHWLTD